MWYAMLDAADKRYQALVTNDKSREIVKDMHRQLHNLHECLCTIVPGESWRDRAMRLSTAFSGLARHLLHVPMSGAEPPAVSVKKPAKSAVPVAVDKDEKVAKNKAAAPEKADEAKVEEKPAVEKAKADKPKKVEATKREEVDEPKKAATVAEEVATNKPGKGAKKKEEKKAIGIVPPPTLSKRTVAVTPASVKKSDVKKRAAPTPAVKEVAAITLDDLEEWGAYAEHFAAQLVNADDDDEPSFTKPAAVKRAKVVTVE